jgi:DNA-3-methyladenine glycosylase
MISAPSRQRRLSGSKVEKVLPRRVRRSRRGDKGEGECPIAKKKHPYSTVKASRGNKLGSKFYRRPDVVQIAKDLLGMRLMTRVKGRVATGGRIVETEAYAGPEDRASHAHGNRRTARTEIMFRNGGVAYIFRCYGVHSLFNVVTHGDGIPHAILIRAIEPVVGVEVMMARRKRSYLDRRVAGGPGMLTEALGLGLAYNGSSLICGSKVWIEDCGEQVDTKDIVAGPRVGVDYAGPDAALPWRFRVRGSPWTSLPR